MRCGPIFLIPLLSGCYPAVGGQIISYTTSIVTECFEDATPTATGLDNSPSTTSCSTPPPQGTVTYNMPACEMCGCPSCTLTSAFSTSMPIFGSTGLIPQTYTVTETYVGLSSLPTFATPTSVPYGFTVAVETCTICGDTPLTMTMTYPSGYGPYASSLPGVTGTNPASQTKSPAENSLSTLSTTGSSNQLQSPKPSVVYAGAPRKIMPPYFVTMVPLLIAALLIGGTHH
ncbi:hypothetical protein BJ170DRAFT_730906 [Xylariales sp. AK1849]|nr:hypothetical protein BJ170DRAFT_730906 [Xylariales sp. AK1849]